MQAVVAARRHERSTKQGRYSGICTCLSPDRRIMLLPAFSNRHNRAVQQCVLLCTPLDDDGHSELATKRQRLAKKMPVAKLQRCHRDMVLEGAVIEVACQQLAPASCHPSSEARISVLITVLFSSPGLMFQPIFQVRHDTQQDIDCVRASILASGMQAQCVAEGIAGPSILHGGRMPKHELPHCLHICVVASISRRQGRDQSPERCSGASCTLGAFTAHQSVPCQRSVQVPYMRLPLSAAGAALQQHARCIANAS